MVDDIVGATSRLAFEPNFLKSAFDRVTQKFRSEDWKDPTKMKAYLWECPTLDEKFGDQAEKWTIEFLSKPELIQLLGEPVYLISGQFLYILNNLTFPFFNVGRVYCQLKTTSERNASQWLIGENDICFITRKLGIIIIEVKGIIELGFRQLEICV